MHPEEETVIWIEITFPADSTGNYISLVKDILVAYKTVYLHTIAKTFRISIYKIAQAK